MPTDYEINILDLIDNINQKINVQKQKAHYYENLFKNYTQIKIIEKKQVINIVGTGILFSLILIMSLIC